jgi:hypothetical protein
MRRRLTLHEHAKRLARAGCLLVATAAVTVPLCAAAQPHWQIETIQPSPGSVPSTIVRSGSGAQIMLAVGGTSAPGVAVVRHPAHGGSWQLQWLMQPREIGKRYPSPQLVRLGDGRPLAVWREASSPTDAQVPLMAAIGNTDGTTWTRTTIIASTAALDNAPVLAATGGGHAVVVGSYQREPGRLWFSSFNGSSWTAPRYLGMQEPFFDPNSLEIAGDRQGAAVIYWQDEFDDVLGAKGVLVTPNGAVHKLPRLPNSYGGGFQIIGTGKARFAVAWTVNPATSDSPPVQPAFAFGVISPTGFKVTHKLPLGEASRATLLAGAAEGAKTAFVFCEGNETAQRLVLFSGSDPGARQPVVLSGKKCDLITGAMYLTGESLRSVWHDANPPIRNIYGIRVDKLSSDAPSVTRFPLVAGHGNVRVDTDPSTGLFGWSEVDRSRSVDVRAIRWTRTSDRPQVDFVCRCDFEPYGNGWLGGTPEVIPGISSTGSARGELVLRVATGS